MVIKKIKINMNVIRKLNLKVDELNINQENILYILEISKIYAIAFEKNVRIILVYFMNIIFVNINV